MLHIRFFLAIVLLSFIGWGARAQSMQIHLQDAKKQALVGVSVYDQSQTWLVLTDAAGTANIPFADTILVQYLGWQTQQLSWQTLQAQAGFIQLEASGIALPEIIVKQSQQNKDLSQQKLRINALQIQSQQVSNAVEALQETGGAFVQKSQHGGGSPILRGFEANRILLLVDGVRLNNAIYRTGHLQNGITIDEAALASVEVSYGPGSLAYGSDALGGVVHFKTKEYLPLASQQKSRWSGQAFSRWASGGKELSAHLGLAWQSKKWSSYTAITASDFGELRAGKNRSDDYPDFGKRLDYIERINGQDSIIENNKTHIQYGSAYQQIDALQKVIFQPNQDWLFKLNAQYSNSSDIPRYDALSERRDGQLRFAEWYYGPQQRYLAALSASSNKQRAYADWLQLLLSVQRIAEDRHERKYLDDWRETSLIDVYVYLLNFDAQKRWSQHSIQYGIEGRMDKVNSEAFRTHIETKERLNDVNARYPSAGSELNSAAAYTQYRYHSQDSSLLAEAGVRMNTQSLEARFSASDPIEWPSDYLAGIGGNTQAFTWATGLRWQQNKWTHRAHIASGFRAPNVDDYAKFRAKNSFIQIPNPDLEAEKSLSFDLSTERQLGNSFRLGVTAFYTQLKDIVVRENFELPNGDAFFVSRGDTLFVQANTNRDKARIWGINTQLHWQAKRHWQAKAQVLYTKGERLLPIDDDGQMYVPLDHIPPLFAQASITYRHSKWESSLKFDYQAAKKLEDYAVSSITSENGTLILNREGTSDNLENTAIDPQTGAYIGSQSWWTLDWQASYKINQQLRLRLNINNLFDWHYRPFSSGISAAGRHMVLGAYAWF